MTENNQDQRGPGDQDLIEELAALEHERWAHWQRYLHARCTPGPEGSLIIPASDVRKWAKQMNTSYSDLSEAEKDSDREQVQRYLHVIARIVRGRKTGPQL
ncbi:hypothetical protein ABT304_07575 [Nocardioides sp. NPDC000445]|uniref:hypothetical protein n=1 Tax=Nocardioides sp. NPDC000445 TaxID=3154257 RepID=UPI003321D4D2